MSLITYEDKIALNENPQVANVNKVTADDMNQIKNAINNLFPVGFIISVDNAEFDPNTSWGGTWNRIKGRVIVGVDEDDPDFSTSGKTGGTKEHRHLEGIFAYNGKLGVSNTNIAAQSSKREIYTVNGTTGFTNVPGSQLCDVYSTEYSSNMPPYYTAYRWIKIAM